MKDKNIEKYTMFMVLRRFAMVLYTLFLAQLAVIGLFIDPSGRLYMWIARKLWGRVVLSIGKVKIVVKGGKKLDTLQPYVICSNHASQFDIPALFGALDLPVRFLAKRSLFYIPIFGWSMWLARFIPVDRGAGKKSRLSIEKAAIKIKKGPSLMVFPEGTRSKDGQIGKFKSGAFIIAIKAGVPVLPVALKGTYDILPRGKMAHNSGKIEVIIGNPIETKGLALSDKEKLSSQTKLNIKNMLEDNYF